MDIVVVIPARYASVRLPGKALLPIAGKPMIQHVYERAIASGVASVIIATDDVRIEKAAKGFGATVWMTDPAHATGSDRIAEVVERMDLAADTVVVNVQGDEPLLPPALIAQVARNLQRRPDYDMATLCEPITNGDGVFDSAIVKVVFDRVGRALYFSRAPIPWHRGYFEHQRPPPGHTLDAAMPHKHIGLYAYRAGYLRRFVALPCSPGEIAESLEQLRALHHGAAIHVDIAHEPTGVGVDTESDLQRAREDFAQQMAVK